MDRSEKCLIDQVKTVRQGSKVILEMIHSKENDPHLEVWSVEEKKDLFEETFGFKLEFQAKSS